MPSAVQAGIVNPYLFRALIPCSSASGMYSGSVFLGADRPPPRSGSSECRARCRTTGISGNS